MTVTTVKGVEMISSKTHTTNCRADDDDDNNNNHYHLLFPLFPFFLLLL